MTFENIVAKNEIAHYEQFLLLPQCFQLYLIIKPLFMEIFPVSEKVYMWERVKSDDSLKLTELKINKGNNILTCNTAVVQRLFPLVKLCPVQIIVKD